GSNVPVSKSSPALSLSTTAHYAYTQNVGVLIANGFNSNEVKSTLNALQQNGAFIDVISEKLGTVVGADGTKLEVNKTFTSTYPVLFDSFYVVGGRTENQEKFNQDVMHYINEAYKHYKPIGVATTASTY